MGVITPRYAYQNRIALTGAGGAATTTFDPARKSTHITLSGSNLIATSGSGSTEGTNVPSIASHATGKYHAEFTLTTKVGSSGSQGVGIVTVDQVPDNSVFLGEFNTDWTLGYFSDGIVSRRGTGLTSSSTYTQGDTVVVELDCDGATIKFAVNTGSYSGDYDISGFGGVAIYFSVEGEGNGDVWTANFGASSWVKTPTSGFVAP